MENNKKQIGIWLDFKEAFIVVLNQGNGTHAELKHLRSHIESGVAKGGSRSKTPWGPQGGISENAFLARRKKAEKDYYESILREIDPDTNEIMIFGPAEAKIGLQHSIGVIKHFRPDVKAVLPAESMSEKQIVAAVKDFFTD